MSTTPRHLRSDTKITDEMRRSINDIPQKVYATIVPTRTTKPIVALHTTLGQAKNAVLAAGAPGAYSKEKGGYPVHESEVYRLETGKGEGLVWELVYRIEEGTYPNDLPWKK